jgi:hypothetical protein
LEDCFALLGSLGFVFLKGRKLVTSIVFELDLKASVLQNQAEQIEQNMKFVVGILIFENFGSYHCFIKLLLIDCILLNLKEL